MVNVKHNVFVDLINRYKGKDAIKQQQQDLNNLQQTENQLNDSTKNLENKNKDLGRSQDNVARSSNRVLMGHLGIMFAGMALNRAMGNLTQTSREWVGIGEIMSTTMGIVMLPATIDLLEKGVLPLSEALLGLPEGVQEALGIATLALQGLGGLMQTAGQILLGAGAFKILFPALAAKIGAGLTTAFSAVGPIITIGAGVVLAYKSVTSEGGKSVLYGLGSAIAIGLGGVLLGATALGGIVIGGLVLATIVGVKMVVDDIETEKDLQERMENALFGTATPAEQVLRGFSPTGGQGTMINYGNEYGQRDALLQNLNLNELLLTPEFGSSSTSSSSQVINLNQVNNVQVADLEQFGTMIDQKNQELVQEVRSGI